MLYEELCSLPIYDWLWIDFWKKEFVFLVRAPYKRVYFIGVWFFVLYCLILCLIFCLILYCSILNCSILYCLILYSLFLPVSLFGFDAAPTPGKRGARPPMFAGAEISAISSVSTLLSPIPGNRGRGNQLDNDSLAASLDGSCTRLLFVCLFLSFFV